MLAFNQIGNLGRLGNQMFQYAAVRGIAAMRGYEFGIPPFESSRVDNYSCLLYTSPSPRDPKTSRMPSSA